MTTLDILIVGGCKANPVDSREIVFNKMTSRTPQYANMGHGSTVSLITGNNGTKIIYDSGDISDRDELIQQTKHITSDEIDYVVMSHAHPDHFANNDLFPNAIWFYPINDDCLQSVLSNSGKFRGFAQYYTQLSKKTREFSKYTKLNPDQLPSNWPEEIQIMDASGHQNGLQVLHIVDSIAVNQPLQKTHTSDTVLLTSDAIINEAYAKAKQTYQITYYDGSEQEATQRQMAIRRIGGLLFLAKSTN